MSRFGLLNNGNFDPANPVPGDFTSEVRAALFLEAVGDAEFTALLGRSPSAKDLYFNTVSQTYRYYTGTRFTDLPDLAGKKQLGGFVDDHRPRSTLSWSDVSKILTLTRLSDYDVYVDGERVPITATKTKDISSGIAEGWYYFWLDSSGVLQGSQTFPNFQTSVFVSFVYWDNSNLKALGVSEERHGVIMPPRTHRTLHLGIGTMHGTGLEITGNPSTSPPPTNDTYSKVWLTGGLILDEDLDINIVNSGTPSNPFEQILGSNLTDNAAKLPVFYLSGSGVWRKWDNDASRFAFYHAGGNTMPHYNLYSGGVWSLAEPPTNNFVVYWVVATNFLTDPVFLLPYTAYYGTLAEAQAITPSDIYWGLYPFPERVVMYKLIYRVNTGYTNSTHRCMLYEIEDERMFGRRQLPM